VLSLLVGLAATGCARYPTEIIGQQYNLLIMDLTVSGDINPNYYYYWAIDTTAGDEGPLPVIQGPFFGNGWGTGSITHYVEFTNNQFRVFRFDPEMEPQENTEPQEINVVELGPPYNSFQRADGLRVELDLDTLKKDPADPPLRSVHLNFITVNVLVLPGDLPPADRAYDGLGPTGNNYLRNVSLQEERPISNAQGGFSYEAANDTDVPDIDLTDWRVEVRLGKR
jgi:hypothetical protein